MSAKDRPVSKPANDKYRENYDRIFGVKSQKECKCNMKTKLVGDGCSVCNPEYAADHTKD